MLIATSACAAPVDLFVPIGGGYTNKSLQEFAQIVNAHSHGLDFEILVVPAAYGTSAAQRRANLALAQKRAAAIGNACRVAIRGSGRHCDARLIPLLSHADAMKAGNARPFAQPAVAGVFFLGGDQTVAMRVIAGTPVEKAMHAAFERGVVFSGTSAGDSVESRNMVAGFIDGKGPEEEFRRGAVQVWWGSSQDERGLIFGAAGTLFDQHFYQRGRFGRLINMVAQSAGHSRSQGLLGAGLDFGTGIVDANDRVLKHVFGASSVAIIDFKTAAARYRWSGRRKILSARSILTDILAPDSHLSYSVTDRAPQIDGHDLRFHDPPRWNQCLFGSQRSGELILGGGITSRPGKPLDIFLHTLRHDRVDRIVVVVAGFAKASDAKHVAAQYRHNLRSAGWNQDIEVRTLALSGGALRKTSDIDFQAGFVLAAHDASILARQLRNEQLHSYLQKTMTDGAVVLTEGAMTAAVGHNFAAVPATNSTTLEDAAIAAFRIGGATVDSGLRLFQDVNFVPHLQESRRWGDLYALAKADPPAIAFGVSNRSAIVVRPVHAASGSQCPIVRAVGVHPAVSVDGRAATFRTGTNGTFSALNVLMDVFAPGDAITGGRDMGTRS